MYQMSNANEGTDKDMSADKKEEQVQASSSSGNATENVGPIPCGRPGGAGSTSGRPGGAGSTAGRPGNALTEATKRELVAALRQHWQREMEGGRTYGDVARTERDAARRKVLLRMAEAEAGHAQKWERKLAELGEEPPKEERTLKMRVQGWVR